MYLLHIADSFSMLNMFRIYMWFPHNLFIDMYFLVFNYVPLLHFSRWHLRQMCCFVTLWVTAPIPSTKGLLFVRRLTMNVSLQAKWCALKQSEKNKTIFLCNLYQLLKSFTKHQVLTKFIICFKIKYAFYKNELQYNEQNISVIFSFW